MRDDERRKAWEKVFRHPVEDFDELLRNLAHPEIRRPIWAAYEADQEGKPFYVGDALHSMSPKGEPRPKTALDDPNYRSKYNRLDQVKRRGLLEVVAVPDNRRNRAVLPTAKLKGLTSEFFASTMQFA